MAEDVERVETDETAYETVRAAFMEHSKEPEPADAPEPVAKPVEAPEKSEAPVEVKSTEPGAVRDPKTGKFTRPDAKAPEQASAPVDPQQQPEKVAPPVHWNGAGKIKWEKLPQDIQRQIAQDYQQRQVSDARLQQLDSILSPRKDSLTRMYGSEAAAVHQLFQLSDYAEKNPVEFIKWFAQQRGVNLTNLAPQAQQEPAPEAYQSQDPALQTVVQQVAELTSYLQNMKQTEATQAQQHAASEVEAFISNPANPYANDVRRQMGQLFASGQASTLQDAYDMACWANPDVRKRLIEAEKEAERSRAANSATVKRQAASSVHGAPGTAVPIPQQVLQETPHETVRRVWNEAATGRV